MSESNVTTNHEEIKSWVEARGGHPARVKNTNKGKSKGVLRIDYPGFSGEGTLEELTWGEFFEEFEQNNLAFLYQDEKQDGSESRFSKLIARDEGESKGQAKSAKR